MRLGRPRVWRDAELAPYCDEFGTPTLTTADLFASIVEDQREAELLTYAEADASLSSQFMLMQAKANALNTALTTLYSQKITPLAPEALDTEILERSARAAGIARLSSLLDSALKKTSVLNGEELVATVSKRSFAKSARSKEEVIARPVSKMAIAGGTVISPFAMKGLTFRGGGGDAGPLSMTPTATTATAVTTATNAAPATGRGKRVRDTTAIDPDISTLNDQLKQLTLRIERRNIRVTELKADLAESKGMVIKLEGFNEFLRVQVQDAHSAGQAEAYGDAAVRLRRVSQVWYNKEEHRPIRAAIRDAITQLENGMKRSEQEIVDMLL